jgi:hypothetical protein
VERAIAAGPDAERERIATQLQAARDGASSSELLHIRVGGETVGVAGADVRLLNGSGREVTVHSGAFTDEGMAAHLQTEAAQSGTTEIYMQVNSAGATREGMIRMAHGLRSAYRELSGILVRFYGPNGEVWWTGMFRGPR